MTVTRSQLLTAFTAFHEIQSKAYCKLQVEGPKNKMINQKGIQLVYGQVYINSSVNKEMIVKERKNERGNGGITRKRRKMYYQA